jgi:hypothetical protein
MVTMCKKVTGIRVVGCQAPIEAHEKPLKCAECEKVFADSKVSHEYRTEEVVFIKAFSLSFLNFFFVKPVNIF